jgi:hypothetical protein
MNQKKNIHKKIKKKKYVKHKKFQFVIYDLFNRVLGQRIETQKKKKIIRRNKKQNNNFKECCKRKFS